MPAFALRFVGQEALPHRLSDVDLDQFFWLTTEDVAAIRAQFRGDHRLPAALMLLFMRVAGRPLDGFNVLPRNLLRHTAEVLAVLPPSIASLRSIYKRRQTLFQTPALGQDLPGPARTRTRRRGCADGYAGGPGRGCVPLRRSGSLGQPMVVHASHPDSRRTPPAGLGQRCLRSGGGADPRRSERRRAPPAAQRVIDSAYSARPGSDSTHLEWLRTPSKSHGPSTLAETIDKVRYLKDLGAHDWTLSAVSLAKQQAYARQVQARHPVNTRAIKPSRQLIELVRCLQVNLLELTDVALLQSSRRSQQLFREAADKAQSNLCGARPALSSRQPRRDPSFTTSPRPGKPASSRPGSSSLNLPRPQAAASFLGFARPWPTSWQACPQWLRPSDAARARSAPTACFTFRRSPRLRINPSRFAPAKPCTSSSATCSSRTCCCKWSPRMGGTAKALADMMSLDVCRHLWN